MKRRSLLLIGALSPLGYLYSHLLGAKPPKPLSYAESAQRAEQLHELAANIHTPADGRRLVDFLSDLFTSEIPERWKTSALRDQIAQVEFASVSDVRKLIPEPRLAQAWNTYVETIGAPEDLKITPAELHNLRDALQITAVGLWNRGSRNIWAVPSIYATLPDGHIAPGTRAIEAMRILWDLANMPDTLQATRDRVSKGLLFSEEVRKPQHSDQKPVTQARLELRTSPFPHNPMITAQRDYMERYGNKAFSKAVIAMLQNTLQG